MNAITDLARADLAAAASASDPHPLPLTGLFGLPGVPSHERVLITSDAATGLRTIIAVHNTQRGPGFGGCRLWSYADDASALLDALRLSEGMSLKNALADLPFGGGKAVILRPAGSFNRRALFGAFGRAVHSLNGSYLTAEDVGTTLDDMRTVREQTPYVSGIAEAGQFGGDPSPWTALGVFAAIRAGVQLRLGRPTLDGVRVAIQGLGAVGMHLAALLHAAGAKLTVADLDAVRVVKACAHFDAEARGTREILAADVDVLAPCAMGAVLNAETVLQVQAPLVAGAANNQLASLADGDVLHQRGTLLLPDFLVNAGGIISVVREHQGQGNSDDVRAEVTRIGQRVGELFDRMTASKLTPARLAEAWARERLGAAA